MKVKLIVGGEYALFSRPEMKVERVSYDVITPSAARGILEAIYWKPQIRWVIEQIHVLAPIRFTNIRRNEISATIPYKGKTGAQSAMKAGKGTLGVFVEDVRQQRASLLLKDVRYGIQARIEILDARERDGTQLKNPLAKHLDTFRRRAESGGCFHHPYLGTREFPADFEWAETFPSCPDELKGEKDLGFMLHDIAFDQNPASKEVNAVEPRFFRATMKDGVIQVPPFDHAIG